MRSAFKSLLASACIITTLGLAACAGDDMDTMGFPRTPKSSTNNTQPDGTGGVVPTDPNTDSSTDPATVTVSSLSLTPTALTLNEFGTGTAPESAYTHQFSATVHMSDGSTKQSGITWTSSNPNVATVNPSGKVTALMAGTSTITASASGKSASATLTVQAATVTKIAISPEDLTLNEPSGGKSVTYQFTTLLHMSDGGTKQASATWTSSDPSVATINSSGLLTALQAGTTTITASASGQSTGVTVTIQAATVTKVTVSPMTVTLTERGAGLAPAETYTQQFTGTVNMSDGESTQNGITWTSSDPSVATVDSSGKVTALKEGTTTITALASGQSASATVTVIPISIQEVTISPLAMSLNAPAPGGAENNADGFVSTGQFAATVIKSDGDSTANGVTWTSSDPSVATVDSSGKVTALKEGTTTITALASGQSASATLTVDAIGQVEIIIE